MHQPGADMEKESHDHRRDYCVGRTNESKEQSNQRCGHQYDVAEVDMNTFTGNAKTVMR
jgi:hypothetical protein